MRTIGPSAVLALLLAGCVSQPAPVPESLPVPPVPAGDGIVRRAVCVGIERNAAGQDCPGAALDARTVAGWVAGWAPALLLDRDATVAGIRARITQAASGLRPQDLLLVSLSGHGTRRPDASGDEPDGYDEGVCLYDGTWWDDDVWAFIAALPPCRLLIIADTCHSEGNWRTVGRWATAGLLCRRQWVQLEFSELALPARRGEWAGTLAQIAGCREDSYSYGSAAGGTLTQTLAAQLPTALTLLGWFQGAYGAMPAAQKPVLTGYGDIAAWLQGGPLE